MTSPEYQAPTWVNEDDPDFVEGVSPDLGAGYLNALSGAVEDHGQRLGAAESDVTNLQATALDQAGGDARYILQSNAAGFAPAEATATALAGKQPLAADLTALAGLDSATAGTVASDGAGWVKKTYAQLKTALGLVKGDVGLGNVDNTSDANKPISAATQAAFDAKTTVVVLTATGDGTTDATSAINAQLAAAPAGSVMRGVPGKNYLISAPLVLRAGGQQTLDMTGCTVTLKAGSNCNMVNNAAVTAARSATGASTASGSTALTCTGAAFTSGDVGATITIWGAGPQGQPFDTTITAVTDATHATLAVAPPTTVAGQTVSVGPRDSQVTIVGGAWNRGSVAGAALDLHILRLRRIDGLAVRNVTGRSTAGKYFVNPADCRDVTIDNVACNTWSDGVHLNGPIRGCVIRNVTGNTGDDMVSLTPNDYPAYNDCVGDITDVTIEDIHATTTGIGAATGASFAGLPVKVLGGQGRACKRIRVKRVSGYVPTASGGVWIGDDTGEPLTSGGLIDDVTVEDVNVANTVGRAPIYLLGSNIKRVRIVGVHADNAVQTNGLVWVGGSGTVVDSLIIRDLSVAAMGAGSHVVRVDGTVNNLVIAGVTGATLVGYVLWLPIASSTVNRCSISDVVAGGGSGIFQATTAGASLPRLEVSNVQIASPSWGIGDTLLTTEVHAANVNVSPQVQIFNLRAGASVTMRATNCNFGGKDVQGTGVISSKSLGFPVGVQLLAKNNGDLAYNTNAALACGAGPVVCDGTSWKHLFSGLTY